MSKKPIELRKKLNNYRSWKLKEVMIPCRSTGGIKLEIMKQKKNVDYDGQMRRKEREINRQIEGDS